jgi:hypothetical protein
MSLESSKGWLYDQLFRGKIFDTLDAFSSLLEYGSSRGKRARKRPRDDPEVIDTEGQEKEE